MKATARAERTAPMSTRTLLGMRTLRVVAAASFLVCSASAGAVPSTKVTAIQLRASNSDALITLASELTGGPACDGTLVANQVAFDHTSAGGKSILSLVTSAYLSGKSVSVTGNGLCVSGSTPGTFVEGLESISLN
jgi:hypothetical protein